MTLEALAVAGSRREKSIDRRPLALDVGGKLKGAALARQLESSLDAFVAEPRARAAR